MPSDEDDGGGTGDDEDDVDEYDGDVDDARYPPTEDGRRYCRSLLGPIATRGDGRRLDDGGGGGVAGAKPATTTIATPATTTIDEISRGPGLLLMSAFECAGCGTARRRVVWMPDRLPPSPPRALDGVDCSSGGRRTSPPRPRGPPPILIRRGGKTR